MTSLDTNSLYNRSTSVFNAYEDTLKIFSANWKPLLTIALLQILSFVGVSIVLMIVFSFMFIGLVKELASNLPYDYTARHLIAHTVGSGASRALENYADQMENVMGDDEVAASIITLFTNYTKEMAIMVIISLFVYAFVSGVFNGAMYHAVAEVYAGSEPTARKSINHGWERKWQIYLYNLIVFFIFVLIFGSVFGGAFYTFMGVDGNFDNDTGIILMMLVTIVSMTIVSFVCVRLVATVPVIVVENKTATAAFGRSWNLCKGSFCYIFCSILGYHLTYGIAMRILSYLPGFLADLSSFCLDIASLALGPILYFILYMSTRISCEKVTQDELRIEIGNGTHVPLDDRDETTKV